MVDTAGLPLAMAWVAMQPFENLYTPENALRAGTVFRALDLPLICVKEVRS